MAHENGRQAETRRKRRPAPQRTWAFDLAYGRAVVEDLSSGYLTSDGHFNGILSPAARQVSARQWTPVAVARRAASLLATGKQCRILDVGSGVGKFCVVGALTTKAHFFGVERRFQLVQEAEKICRVLNVPRIQFFRGEMSELDWSKFDAFYLFNPFYENIDSSAPIDRSVKLGEDKFREFILITQAKLSPLPIGTRVVTYHGFGGRFPPGYQREIREPWGEDFLELWVKRTVKEGYLRSCRDSGKRD